MRKRILAMIMAGGRGERLGPLTQERAKPAVPFGGKYRIIDFVLSNFVNSGIYSIYVLTQFKSQSLTEHLRTGWGVLSALREQFIIPVPAQMRRGETWYRGTADAIYQNLNLIADSNPDLVAVFGADHIYKMDVSQMVAWHLERGAEVSVGALPVPIAEAHKFGVLQVDREGRITGFEEKPEKPKPIPGNASMAYVSMGNYLFDRATLLRALKEDAEIDCSQHDFGRDVIPRLVEGGGVHAYNFHWNRLPGASDEENRYWRDVGTLDAYFEAHLDLRAVTPALDLYNLEWPIRTANFNAAPAKFVHDFGDRIGRAINSIVCEGSILSGCLVRDSVVARNTRIHSFAQVEESILMDNVVVGRHARIRRAIIDKNVEITEGDSIGFDLEKDRERFFVTESGLVVLPKRRVVEVGLSSLEV